MSNDPVKQAWLSSVEIAGAPPLEEVRAGADKFYRFVRLRNFVEYAACVIVVVTFGWYIFWLPDVLQKAGSAMVVAGTFYVAWQLHRRASAEPPEKAGTMPLYLFMRAQFVRHRDALRSLFWWYILPFLPGMVLVVIGSSRANAGAGRPTGWPELLFGVCFGAFVAGLLWWNRRAANMLQKHIDEIDALTGGKE
jgi:hypothetical protein